MISRESVDCSSEKCDQLEQPEIMKIRIGMRIKELGQKENGAIKERTTNRWTGGRDLKKKVERKDEGSMNH